MKAPKSNVGRAFLTMSLGLILLPGLSRSAHASDEEGIVPVERDCAIRETTEEMVYGDREFPRSGHLYTESHLATQLDVFEDGRLFPSSKTENIEAHIQRSCAVIEDLWPAVDCDKVYRKKWDRQWTPPENGLAGQGARGNERPSVLMEAFTFNMFWKKAPKPGTRYLLSHGEHTVVAVAGFEIGPADESILGGMQPEVAYFLRADNEDKVRVARLKDQTLPLGPVKCKKEKAKEADEN